MNQLRCAWPGSDPLMVTYHDTEWGVPLHDDPKLFEFLVLDAMQAGLSWRTVLYKRENFEKAFDGFDIAKISKYSDKKFERLMLNEGIIRNRLKIVAAIANAKATLKVQKEIGSLDTYLWQFVDGSPIVSAWSDGGHIPAQSPEAVAMSKDMKKRDFKFVGPTTCYAFMQAAGLVNDHVTDCFRYKELTKKSK
ncbi:MAG TPA: DNA-3-methyladenine glycosylase I [Acidimicrobiales bacterium]|jgi:DNA-3-methyladenine glycosylase I|nr:DNA-3-methyladenine glycosylase I [Acidimicrobiales bacterium]